MSWDRWHVTGIGMDIENVEPEKYRNFILHHKDFVGYEGIIEYLEEEPECVNNGDFTDTIRDCTGSWTLSEPVASIITAETDIRFGYPGLSENGMDCILFSPAFPWDMNENEKALVSVDSIIDILKPYAEELGLVIDPYIDCIYEG